ncbi:MAG: adenylate/guanylate cyclase domain-containing protein [Propionivibrio sp.]
MEPVPQAAVLFADVSGSTRLYEIAGDAIASAAIDKCLALLRQVTEAIGGRVVKTLGDEIMSVFASADAAAVAAMDMQNGVTRLPPAAGIKIGIRIGFNFGPVVERNQDVFGDAVNVAARLASMAQRDQIITSRETVQALSPVLRDSCRQLYSIQVKGKAQEVELCEVMWQQNKDATTLVMSMPRPRQPRTSVLRLYHADREIVLDATRGSLTLGRDKSAELVIQDAQSSRMHCRIERRMDKFILADHSTNGTYVTVEGDKEIILLREEFTLRSHGWIAFGQARADTVEVVEFFYEG